MKDRQFLDNLTAMLESSPSLNMDKSGVLTRLRAIRDTIPEDQDTSTQRFSNAPVWEVKTVVSTGIPPGIFVFTTGQPTPDAPPTIIGIIKDDKVYGVIERAHHIHVSSADRDKLMEKIDEMNQERETASID